MGQHGATIRWRRGDDLFRDGKYSRAHRWSFDGGIDVPASASPKIVPAPLSVAEAIDPEEAFVASLSSCHMLWFLSIAAERGFVVDRYEDEATGTLAKNEAGQLLMTRVVLRPRVAFGAEAAPSPEVHDQMHHEAHARCFLASSVRSEMHCEPELA